MTFLISKFTSQSTLSGSSRVRSDVETFELEGHPQADKAFGWAWKDGSDEIQYIGILNVPPIDSPREAVQAAIASGRFT